MRPQRKPMRRKINFLLAGLLVTAQAALAQGAAIKTIEIEWEEIPKTAGYEVRMMPKGGGKTLKFLAIENRMVQDVPVGHYTMQIRSRAKEVDYFSPWSEPVPIEVVAKEITPLKPADQATISALGLEKYTVEFEWQPVEGVKEYTLKVWNEHRRDKPWIFTTSKTRKKLDVPPGDVYYWQVLFESNSAVSYAQAPTTFIFTLLGVKLTTPEIIPPESTPTLKHLSWRASDGATAYSVKLFYRHLDEKDWKKVREVQLTSNRWDVHNFKRGAYRLDVQATAPRRTSSDVAQLEFLVKPSDAELQQALTR